MNEYVFGPYIPSEGDVLVLGLVECTLDHECPQYGSWWGIVVTYETEIDGVSNGSCAEDVYPEKMVLDGWTVRGRRTEPKKGNQ